MGVSTEKSKIMANSTNNISADIKMNGQKLEEMTSLQGWHLLSRRLHQDCSVIAAMARLNRIRWCNIISFASKFKLYKSLVTSILP